MRFLVILWVTQKLLSRPLTRLTQATEALSLENLQHSQIDIQTGPETELKILETAFNKMTNKLFQATKALQESETQLRTVIDLVPHPIVAKDKTGKLHLVNQAFADKYQTTTDEIDGKNFQDIHAHKEEIELVLKHNQRIIENRTRERIPELSLTNKQGKIEKYQSHIVPFLISGVETSLSIAVDITDLKQTQSDLQHLNENRCFQE